ncbi:unnamed protein product, partial [Meganyctiphanes norvegica]
MSIGSDSESEYSEAEAEEYSDVDDIEAAEYDSDKELQEAFAKGELKPGLTVIAEKTEKVYKNNVAGLKQKLGELKQKLPWVERLDLINAPAAMAPEMSVEIEEHGQTREKRMKNSGFRNFELEEDMIHNDFKREMNFYRQAQASVLEGLSRLQDFGFSTKRPEDYFAQMAKSDEHMDKVRQKLQSSQVKQQLAERARKMRDLKKFGKKVQVEAIQRKHKEKRDMLDQINKFRKGKADAIDFLEDGPLRKNGDTRAQKKDLKKMLKYVLKSKQKYRKIERMLKMLKKNVEGNFSLGGYHILPRSGRLKNIMPSVKSCRYHLKSDAKKKPNHRGRTGRRDVTRRRN